MTEFKLSQTAPDHVTVELLEGGHASVGLHSHALPTALRLWWDIQSSPAEVGPDTPVLLEADIPRDGPPVWALADDDTPETILNEDEDARARRLQIYVGVLKEAVGRGEAVVVSPEYRDYWDGRVAASAVRHLLWGRGDTSASPDTVPIVSAKAVLARVLSWAEEAKKELTANCGR